MSSVCLQMECAAQLIQPLLIRLGPQQMKPVTLPLEVRLQVRFSLIVCRLGQHLGEAAVMLCHKLLSRPMAVIKFTWIFQLICPQDQ